MSCFCLIFSDFKVHYINEFDLLQFEILKLFKLSDKKRQTHNPNVSQVSRQLPPVITGTYGRMILSVVVLVILAWFPKIGWQKWSPFLTVSWQFPRLAGPREITHKLGFLSRQRQRSLRNFYVQLKLWPDQSSLPFDEWACTDEYSPRLSPFIQIGTVQGLFHNCLMFDVSEE